MANPSLSYKLGRLLEWMAGAVLALAISSILVAVLYHVDRVQP